uniref:AAA family ATPase n=2 Tax=Flavobacterium sp. TaxID=239 RepID=UPI00404B8563
MQLLESKFNNFRCFKNYPIKYGKQTTVIIGKNGTGKSSILSAIRRGLSIFFADSKGYLIDLNFSNGNKVQKYYAKDFNYNDIQGIFEAGIDNYFKVLFNNKTVEWHLAQFKLNNPPDKELYIDATNLLLNEYNRKMDNRLPLFVVYSDNFPHVNARNNRNITELIQLDRVPRDLGYYKWDEKENIIDLWLDRYFKIVNFDKDLNDDIERLEDQIFWTEKQIDNKDEFDEHKVTEWEDKIEQLKERIEYLKSDKRRNQFAKERQYIEDIFTNFTGPLSKEYEFINKEFQVYSLSVYRPNKKEFELSFNFADARNIMFDMLPMGYKRIFSMVLDIAYRSYILNEDAKSHGIVSIDEIELHLHPTLQQEIVQRLQKTFPHIQFIVTTHSPLVISNFKADEKNKIIKLERDGNNYWNEEVENIYGIDYTTGLMDIMGAKYRASSIDNLIDSIVILASRNRLEDAEKIKKELYAIVGENNEYIENEIESRIEMNKK